MSRQQLWALSTLCKQGQAQHISRTAVGDADSTPRTCESVGMSPGCGSGCPVWSITSPSGAYVFPASQHLTLNVERPCTGLVDYTTPGHSMLAWLHKRVPEEAKQALNSMHRHLHSRTGNTESDVQVGLSTTSCRRTVRCPALTHVSMTSELLQPGRGRSWNKTLYL